MHHARLLMSRAVLMTVAIAIAAHASHAGATLSTSPALTAATLRSPQIRLGGTALQSYLNSVPQSIDAAQGQFVGELVRSNTFSNQVFTIQIELDLATPGTVCGLYNGHDANPALMPLFPAEASIGWFAVATFRPAPARLIVNVLDANVTLRSNTIFLGADRNAVGFYASSPAGTFYSQDSRNPDGAAQCLFFRGTGQDVEGVWLALELQPLVSSDRDFDDTVLFLETFAPAGIVETMHSSWGQLKARFR